MENRNIDKIIFDYLNGKASANDVEKLRNWLNNEENSRIFQAIKSYLENSKLEVTSPDTEKAYNRLLDRIYGKENEKAFQIEKNPAPTSTLWRRYAAILLFFISFAGLFYILKINTASHSQMPQVNQIIKENPKGQKLTTFLSDGSKVILNSSSKIKYISPFSKGKRVVELEGEAFFEVKNDPSRPFMVKTNGVTTTALGTSFNVHYREAGFVEVSLVSGKVKVKKTNSKESVILVPGRSAVVTKNGYMTVRKFNYIQKVGWKDGILVFKNDSFTEVVDKLEDWYGKKILGAETVVDKSNYNGIFRNEMLEDVLKGLSFVYKFDYKISGDTIKVISKP